MTQNLVGLQVGQDTINVVTGWNMVGTISNPVDTGAIISLPPGLRASLWYGYAGSCSVAAQLIPGQAYWAKANSPGAFVPANPRLARP